MTSVRRTLADRRREREAYARRGDFRRYTYGDVFEQPEMVLAELRSFFTFCLRPPPHAVD